MRSKIQVSDSSGAAAPRVEVHSANDKRTHPEAAAAVTLFVCIKAQLHLYVFYSNGVTLDLARDCHLLTIGFGFHFILVRNLVDRLIFGDQNYRAPPPDTTGNAF